MTDSNAPAVKASMTYIEAAGAYWDTFKNTEFKGVSDDQASTIKRNYVRDAIEYRSDSILRSYEEHLNIVITD